MSTLILVRHGESTSNAENRFTGWFDADLTPRGEHEARAAGALLAGRGIAPDVVHTSVQTRAIRSANLALEVMGRSWLPVQRSWRLNERHYGALQGLDKKQTAQRYGTEQVFRWRRSYNVRPPALADDDDDRHARRDPRYTALPDDVVPTTECLADVLARVLPYWYDTIVADLASGRQVLVVAHGNSLRALVKHLKGLSERDIVGLNIATGQPWQFELDGCFNVIDDGYLDPVTAAERAAAVAAEAR
jgi:2,3-bisphosphoglycerate-dependent phosphoglycerate mutase